jgi:hypothetical protein
MIEGKVSALQNVCKYVILTSVQFVFNCVNCLLTQDMNDIQVIKFALNKE